jgi:hypothetical protein
VVGGVGGSFDLAGFDRSLAALTARIEIVFVPCPPLFSEDSVSTVHERASSPRISAGVIGLAASAEYRLGERWLAGLLAYRSTALNREYADVMGELPAYTMIGVTLRYRLNVRIEALLGLPGPRQCPNIPPTRT